MAARPPATFQPRFTLGIVYLTVFFFLYSVALAAPALLEVLRTVPTGPEQEEAARAATQNALRGRLWIAVAGSLVTTAAAAWAGVLPGLRPPR